MKNANNDNETFISIGLHALLILNKFKTTAALIEQASETESPNQKEQPTDYPTQGHGDEHPRRALA